MIDYRDPKTSEAQIKRLARRVMSRLTAAKKTTMTIEDIQQEMWIAWIVARDSFDPERGIPFGAYLHRGLLLHINRAVNRQVFNEAEFAYAASLDYEMDEDGTKLQEILPSNAMSAEQIVSRVSCYKAALRNLSPRARDFVRVLAEQPQELMEDLKTSEHKSRHARGLGLACPGTKRLTASVIFDVMGADRRERSKILAEVEKLGERLSR